MEYKKEGSIDIVMRCNVIVLAALKRSMNYRSKLGEFSPITKNLEILRPEKSRTKDMVIKHFFW
jgi:hypothetical protein